MKDNRFQNQPLHIKFWRYRYYLLIPFNTLILKIKNPYEPWELLWSINVGLAQFRMNWYYEWEEVVEKLNSKSDVNNDN